MRNLTAGVLASDLVNAGLFDADVLVLDVGVLLALFAEVSESAAVEMKLSHFYKHPSLNSNCNTSFTYSHRYIYTQIPCFRFTSHGMMRQPLNLSLIHI